MRDLRVAASLAAAAVGVLICVHQQHFVLDWRDPGGFGVVFEHRCGLVMVAAMAWMVVEVITGTFSWSRSRRPGT